MTATKKPDLDAILPSAESLDIEGIPARVRRLKSREFLFLMRVLTTGLGPAATQIEFDTDDPERMRSQIVGAVIMAVPNAIDEFGVFLLSIVEAKDQKDQSALAKIMQNPDPDVLIDVITILAEQEKDDLTALAGKARAALTKIQALYSKPGQPDRSRARST